MSDDPRAVWALGDYAVIARRLWPAAGVLVELAQVARGDRVVDVAAGSGNVAIAAQAAGAHVTAIDFSPHMLALGRARTEGSGIEWLEADAHDLPFEDAAFDAALSGFGAVVAPDPEEVAAELLRVVRPGGVIGLTTWAADGLQGTVGARMAAEFESRPPYPGDVWVRPGGPDSLFGDRAEVAVHRRTLTATYPSMEAWVDSTAESAPPVVAVRSALSPERWSALRADIVEIARDHAQPVPEGLELRADYDVILARRR